MTDDKGTVNIRLDTYSYKCVVDKKLEGCGMARLQRVKETGGADGWYHLYSCVAGRKGEYPLDDDRCREKLLGLIRFYSDSYCCGVASYAILGNHYHLVCRFDKPRKLSKAELWERALKFYPRHEKALKFWSDLRWQRFSKRIFDVSEFMRNIQSAFAIWYNRKFSRKGRFWADRFKSTLLLDSQAVLDAVLYVDLNGVRAGLAERPEDYKPCSAYLREIRADRWLIPLGQFMNKGLDGLYREYKGLLYYRGAIQTKHYQKVISPRVLRKEEARGFKESGVYLNKLRYFTDGVVLGAKQLVQEKLKALCDTGHIKRRQKPKDQEEGCQHSLREQRINFVSLE